jgi:hypothetical protein
MFKNGFTFQHSIVEYKMPAMTNYNANTFAYERFLTKQLETIGARTHGSTKRKEERLLRFLEHERNQRMYYVHRYEDISYIVRLN